MRRAALVAVAIDAGYGDGGRSVGIGVVAIGLAITSTGAAYAAELDPAADTIHIRALPPP